VSPRNGGFFVKPPRFIHFPVSPLFLTPPVTFGFPRSGFSHGERDYSFFSHVDTDSKFSSVFFLVFPVNFFAFFSFFPSQFVVFRIPPSPPLENFFAFFLFLQLSQHLFVAPFSVLFHPLSFSPFCSFAIRWNARIVSFCSALLSLPLGYIGLSSSHWPFFPPITPQFALTFFRVIFLLLSSLVLRLWSTRPCI